MKILKRTQFGNPILRQEATRLSNGDIMSDKIQSLIRDMYYTLEKKRYGVGLAAPQVGESVALAVVGIKPTPTRPDAQEECLTVINPRIIKTYGNRTGMREACISGGDLYAKAMRYKKVRLHWLDETAAVHEQDFEGLMAHVLQHEIDHLNGILFVDKVKDTKTYMTFSEYNKIRKRRLKQKS